MANVLDAIGFENRYLLSLAAVAPDAAEAVEAIDASARRWARQGGPPPDRRITPAWSGTEPAQHGLRPGSFLLLPGTHIIGRGSQCSLQFDVRGVSRRHLALQVLQGRGLVVRDLGSTNGTFVNGQRVREAAIDGPTLLDVGPLRLVLRPCSEPTPKPGIR